MREITHPLSLAVYGLDPETGLVKVSENGKVGFFTENGEWKAGDIFDIDPQMCVWVGGPNPDAGASKNYKLV
jgi:hypothetical protein